MMARPMPGNRGFRIPEERKNALYEAMFNIFAWDKRGRDMHACICGLPVEHRSKISTLCKDLGIDPDEYLAQLQSHGVFTDVGWEHLLATEAAHPRSPCAPAYVLYYVLFKLCEEKGIHQYRTFKL